MVESAQGGSLCRMMLVEATGASYAVLGGGFCVAARCGSLFEHPNSVESEGLEMTPRCSDAQTHYYL